MDKPADDGDAGDREFLGTVILNDGRTLRVCMPTMGDIELMLQPSPDGKPVSPYALHAAACGLSLESFRRLSMVDGNKVSQLLTSAYAILGTFAGKK